MLFDLLLAAAATLLLGLPVFIWHDLLPKGAWEIPIVIVSLALSLGAGVAILTRNHRSRIVPIASIYIAVMFGVMLYIAFVIGWHLGRVDL
jgi:CHASE2 domain-containing sensor protein